MNKKMFIITVLLILTLPAVLTFDTSSASTKVKTYSVTVTEGKNKLIKLPKKQKYYASHESNAKISSFGKKNARSFTIAAISNGTSKVYVTTTKNQSYCYKVTIKKVPKPQEVVPDTTEAEVEDQTVVDVDGKCPHCKKGGCLTEINVSYTRPEIKTGWLKEPLISSYEYRSMQFLKTMTEEEIQALVKSWKGLIVRKRNWYNTPDDLYNTKDAYDVLVPCKYAYLTVPSDYQKQLASKYNVNPIAVVSDNSLGDCTYNRGHYLTEWTVEEETYAPAQKVSLSTGLYQCSKCGYIFEK